MTNPPPGYGYPSDPQNPQNPYGQQPSSPQSGYGVPQGPYDPQPGYTHQPQPDYAQQAQPGYVAPPPGYPQQPAGYAPNPAYPQLPYWMTPPSPYGPPQPGSRTLASSADRFLARLIDAVILAIPVVILQIAVSATLGIWVTALVDGAIYFGYEALMLLTQGQQSVGKKAMKLRVVALADGGRPTDNQLVGRAAVFALPQAVYCLGSLFFLVNVLSLTWDKPLQQCFHDKAGKTVVVKEY
ncbi:putative RDD family membrane protein YckC [Kitasatospora sp. GP30]|uniref:RDD family protein n=1 Tax=Kitasatospora sp. GP30 TaxID=3035084 RepID=UPI000C710D4E|nr:RDD family protein [Kitasatospora sp. GP30]MDH6144636.1 putative RDD family membrane protein YckC [Kitasatospora sp. GP30]